MGRPTKSTRPCRLCGPHLTALAKFSIKDLMEKIEQYRKRPWRLWWGWLTLEMSPSSNANHPKITGDKDNKPLASQERHWTESFHWTMDLHHVHQNIHRHQMARMTAKNLKYVNLKIKPRLTSSIRQAFSWVTRTFDFIKGEKSKGHCPLWQRPRASLEPAEGHCLLY